MRSLAVSIERNITFSEPFETEPYEAGWASEARIFAHVFKLEESLELRLIPQISLDGIFWCDYKDANQNPLVLSIREMGVHSLLLHGFGQWLRLRAELLNPDSQTTPSASMNIHFALKG